MGLTERFGRYLEVPFAVPFFICVVPPLIALVRRRRRIHRDFNIRLATI
jgi:hypothetical protein